MRDSSSFTLTSVWVLWFGFVVFWFFTLCIGISPYSGKLTKESKFVNTTHIQVNFERLNPYFPKRFRKNVMVKCKLLRWNGSKNHID